MWLLCDYVIAAHKLPILFVDQIVRVCFIGGDTTTRATLEMPMPNDAKLLSVDLMPVNDIGFCTPVLQSQELNALFPSAARCAAMLAFLPHFSHLLSFNFLPIWDMNKRRVSQLRFCLWGLCLWSLHSMDPVLDCEGEPMDPLSYIDDSVWLDGTRSDELNFDCNDRSDW